MTKPIKSLLVVYSYHHMNTEKVAKVFANILDAQIRTPQQLDPNDLHEYDLVGFGAGIDSGKDHSDLRKKLESKGYNVVDEFQCKGFNTNSFMRFFGGMNRGRPNDKDLKDAETFALNLKGLLQV